MMNVPDNEAVRIFVEFEKISFSIKGQCHLKSVRDTYKMITHFFVKLIEMHLVVFGPLSYLHFK